MLESNRQPDKQVNHLRVCNQHFFNPMQCYKRDLDVRVVRACVYHNFAYFRDLSNPQIHFNTGLSAQVVEVQKRTNIKGGFAKAPKKPLELTA